MDRTQFIIDWKIASKYDAPRESAIYKDIPIEFRHSAEIEKFMKSGKYLIRYRGPRRKGTLGQQMCLKKDATRFAIYLR